MTKKTMSVSARVNADKFELFKEEYLKQLKGSFKDSVPSEIYEDVLEVSNSELIDRAVNFALLFLEDYNIKKGY